MTIKVVYKNSFSPGSRVLVSTILRLAATAENLGLRRFEDDLYGMWAHPYVVGDILNSCTFTQRITLESNEYSSIIIAGVRIFETTNVTAMYLFGKNSDPRHVKTYDLEYDGSFSDA